MLKSNNWFSWNRARRTAMAGRAKAYEEKDLCCYVAETNEDGVKEEVVQLISKCIQDKIFSSSPDMLFAVRDDNLRGFSFTNVDWNILRNVENTFRLPRAIDEDYKSNPISVISAVCDSIELQLKEDTFRNKKVLFFGNFNSDLKEKDIVNLAEQLKNGQIVITIVVPDKTDQREVQKENVKILNRVLGKLPETVRIITLKEATLRLVNLATKKAVRSSPWAYDLEIGEDLTIPVGYYVCTRKNVNSQTKQAILKEVSKLPGGNKDEPSHSTSSSALEPFNPRAGGSGPAGPIAELKSKVVQKEDVWTQNDGTVIDLEEIVEGYYYGDKLVPFDAIQQSNQYSTGEKCFKVLMFYPKDSIKPCHLVGDGNDVVFPKKNDPSAEIKFVALVQAMHNTNRVAIVRKVRTSNAKMVIGVLSADVIRKCLVFVELCFADDVSIPFFAPLIKEKSPQKELSANELLIDELIKCKSIDSYVPAEGPVDPAVHALRDIISRKFLGTSARNIISTSRMKDGIELFFEEGDLEENIVKRLKEAFPTKEVVEKGSDRPSGQQIFRKRNRDQSAIENVDIGDKKARSENITESNLAIKEALDAAAEMFDPDNLLDDM